MFRLVTLIGTKHMHNITQDIHTGMHAHIQPHTVALMKALLEDAHRCTSLAFPSQVNGFYMALGGDF